MTRRRLKEREVLTVLLLQGAKIPCALCPDPITLEDVETIERDHSLPVGLGGGDDLGNQGFVHDRCHKAKTLVDCARMDKADRQKLKHETGRSSKAKRKLIVSRGFDKTLRKKMNGQVERI